MRDKESNPEGHGNNRNEIHSQQKAGQAWGQESSAGPEIDHQCQILRRRHASLQTKQNVLRWSDEEDSYHSHRELRVMHNSSACT